MGIGFDRTGSKNLRQSGYELLANHLGLTEATKDDIDRGMRTLLDRGRQGILTDPQVEQLDRASDLLERIDSIDNPWIFGQRYMRHRFVSTDPVCPHCYTTIPHRTLLICPSCNEYGPWEMTERKLESSYAHRVLVEQVRRLVGNELIMKGGKSYADGMVTAMPRGGAKSTWLCEIVALWLVLTGRSRCLLVLSNTIKQVQERSVEIRNELEENIKIVEDFGIQAAKRQDKRVWTQEDFVLANGARVVARGAMQSMRGVKNNQYRPDAVIGDDADDDKFLSTPDMARKLWEWWDNRVVPACAPNSIFMMNGTVLGEMALLWQMKKGHRGMSYFKRTFKALEDRPGCESCGMPAERVGRYSCPSCQKETRAVQPSSFWGARFTVPALQSIKQRIGHWAWQSEFQQEAHDDASSWFEKAWLDKAYRDDLPPLDRSRRRVLPWSVIQCTLTGEEAVRIAALGDSKYDFFPGDLGPYQVLVQSWDPAWARKKGPEQKSCYMAGVTMGLTWDDKIDIFYINRDRGLAGNAAYREWMYRDWKDWALPMGSVERPEQVGMIIERNGGGVLFQYGMEDHWGSVPILDHNTGAEKHDLEDGIPGLASWCEKNRIIIRAGGTPHQREMAEELVYEMKFSGRSQYTDMLMATWFGWAYINRWIRDVRDPARYLELSRRNAAGQAPRPIAH